MAEERSIEFEIIKEPWNKYQLQDNSVLKTRTILKSVGRLIRKSKVQYLVDAQDLTVIHAGPNLRGDANPNQISNDEISRNMEIDDMRYDRLAQEFNEYLLDDGTKIKIHPNIICISRSSLKDVHGDPIYSVLSSNQVWIKPAKI